MTVESLLTLHPETLRSLQALVRANLDSAAAFRECAEVVDDDDLVTRLLGQAAERRAGFGEELATYLSLNEAELPTTGRWLEGLRRIWIDLRARLSGGDTHVVLVQLERAEEMLRSKYEQVLLATAGSPANATLLRHYREIKQTHDAIRVLADSSD